MKFPDFLFLTIPGVKTQEEKLHQIVNSDNSVVYVSSRLIAPVFDVVWSKWVVDNTISGLKPNLWLEGIFTDLEPFVMERME